MSPAKLLAAFDFDHTIVDDNSDVVARRLLKCNAPIFDQGTCWTDYMQQIFELLQKQGTTPQEIRKAIIGMKEVKGFAKLVNFLYSADAEIIVISDANEYFIEKWLRSKKLDHVVAHVFTNPAEFDGGTLRIQKHHKQDWCALSSENLCKGHILENYIEKRKVEGVEFDKILYVGDGNNDYCPSLKLREEDVTFPRKGYAFMQKLDQLGDKNGIKSKIHVWSTHMDILNYIKEHVYP
ncbi:Hypothetical protein phosphate phosphatase Hypothetical proteinOSHypothetical proteinO2 [Nesidiocoris tenuis]|uniref:Pyridoxal phosphate phosphatase PHOSPHO2 n=1 Tax=Nesidiocoris tenuis TaxID=355587 RepID=A0ABN7B5Q7_9HEMI|nr:Hypothetical protein phosphate phosphatase Hypothetical proteinOSHypothetical proteinO2 [Nesidiocoris tenuis]